VTATDELEPKTATAPAPEEIAPPAADSPAPPARPAKNPVRTVVLVAFALLLLLYGYSVVADRITPYSSQATIDTLLVQIAPEVSGQVVEVGVVDNKRVKKGQMLFRIDPRPFEIALRSAEANLAVALQAAEVSSVDIGVAQAVLRKQQVDLDANRRLGRIVTDLVDMRALPQTNAIRARAEVAKTQADVARAAAEVERARQNLGAAGDRNAKVRQAAAVVQQARLDLSNTVVTAPADGAVTNLRLSAGQFVSRGQPLLSFIQNGPRWVSAAMRENQLGNLAPGNKVLVALDDNPGQVVPGRVESIGWGITQGGEAPTGQLPDVESAAGWLREPQSFPVRIVLMPARDGRTALSSGRSGAQANVIIFTDPDSALNPIGRFWIKLVALLSYLR
jgi:multidrug resistance efflux pump